MALAPKSCRRVGVFLFVPRSQTPLPSPTAPSSPCPGRRRSPVTLLTPRGRSCTPFVSALPQSHLRGGEGAGSFRPVNLAPGFVQSKEGRQSFGLSAAPRLSPLVDTRPCWRGVFGSISLTHPKHLRRQVKFGETPIFVS